MAARIWDVLKRHRGLSALLAVHAVLFWAVIAAGSPWATAGVECASGAMAEGMLGSSSWSPWDLFHGALGGMFVAALAGLPLFAVFGVTALGMKILVWLCAVVVVVVAYHLLDRTEGRRAAAIGAAGLVFAPPALFHVSSVYGNWHWTQAVFDYGVTLVALELARRGAAAGLRSWAAMGLVTGFGVFNCVASVPFMALPWLLVVVAQRSHLDLRKLAAGAGGLVLGAAPFLYKLWFHRPFGLGPTPRDQTLGRLSSFRPQLDKALDLVHPELPWALHVHDVLPQSALRAAFTAEVLWVVLLWAGTLWGLVSILRSLRLRGVLAAAGALPALYALVFSAAYVVLSARLEVLPVEFSNVREHGHRMVPPLLVALVLGGAVGWSRFIDGRRGPLRLLGWGAALVPAAVGLVSILGILQQAPEGAGVSDYRASCTDVLGVNGAATLRGEAEALAEVCGQFDDPIDRRNCRLGAGWGMGMHRGQPRFLPKNQRPEGWSEHSLGFPRSTWEACISAEDDIEEACFFGLGWSVGSMNWGRARWPLPACGSLPDPGQQRLCWRGVGFPLGDHLHPSPWKIQAVLERVPAPWRAHTAQGVGLSVARSYAGEAPVFAVCAALQPPLDHNCRLGAQSWWSP